MEKEISNAASVDALVPIEGIKELIFTVRGVQVILDRMEALEPTMLLEQLFATGCVWDAYSYVCDLVRSAARRIVLIDNFMCTTGS